MASVVDDGELGLRDGVVGAAVVEVYAARDEFAPVRQFVAVVEDLRSEVTLDWNVSG